MKDAWPVEAQALGGRHYRGDNIDQNFDTYAVEYTFADGAKLLLDGRMMPGCHDEFASYAHGTKGSASISQSAHTPAKCQIFRGQNIRMRGGDLAWAFPQPEPNPYQLEWNDLVDAIRNDKPYNEAERGTAASLVTVDGPHGRAHRPGDHLRPDAQLRARVRARRRQARAQRPRADHRPAPTAATACRSRAS